MKRIKRILILLLILIIFGLGAYVAYDLYEKRLAIQTAAAAEAAAFEALNQKLRLEAAIIESVHTKKELITLEVDVSDTVEWDDSWGSLDIFHKSQRIRFYGTGLYVTDLAQITSDDIRADPEQEILTVSLPKPAMKSVTIDEDKSEYESVEKGWFRFGNIQLTPEQYNAMYATVKAHMEKQLESPELYQQAEISAQAAAQEIFQLLVNTLDKGYTVQVDYK